MQTNVNQGSSNGLSIKNFQAKYNEWFIQNSQTVRYAERGLTTALFIFGPSRYGPDELRTELLTCALSLVKLYHDYVWLKKLSIRKTPKTSLTPEDPMAALFDTLNDIDGTSLSGTSPTTETNPLKLMGWLSFVENVSLVLELLMEFVHKKFDKQSVLSNVPFSTSTIFLIELIKAALRFKLLLHSQTSDTKTYPFLAHSILAPRGIVTKDDESQNSDTTGNAEDSDNSEDSEKGNSSNSERKQRPNLLTAFYRNLHANSTKKPTSTRIHNNRGDEGDRFFNPRQESALTLEKESFLSPFVQCSALTSVPITSILAEVLWILRPLLYLTMLIKYKSTPSSPSPPSSWWPWLVSLTIDVLSWHLHSRWLGRVRDTLPATLSNESFQKNLQQALSSRMRTALVFYLFRPPMADVLFGTLRADIGNSSNSEISKPSGTLGIQEDKSLIAEIKSAIPGSPVGSSDTKAELLKQVQDDIGLIAKVLSWTGAKAVQNVNIPLFTPIMNIVLEAIKLHRTRYFYTAANTTYTQFTHS